MSQFLESIENFKVSFGGKSSIDAELFTKTMDNTISLVKATAEVVDPSCFLRLEIKTNQEGSFETVIDAVVNYKDDLLAASSVAGNILQGVLNFILIKKHLNGKKAKRIETKGDETAIQNQEDKVLKVPESIGNAYFKDNRIDNIVVNITNNVSEGNRDSYCIETKNQKVEIKKEEYNAMATGVIDEKPIAQTITQKPIEVELPLKKPDLLGDSKWEFIYNKAIAAKIEDSTFLEAVHQGKVKNLYAGVKIKCMLQVEYDLDERSELIPKSDRYTVLNVLGDIIEPTEIKNRSLFDEDNES